MPMRRRDAGKPRGMKQPRPKTDKPTWELRKRCRKQWQEELGCDSIDWPKYRRWRENILRQQNKNLRRRRRDQWLRYQCRVYAWHMGYTFSRTEWDFILATDGMEYLYLGRSPAARRRFEIAYFRGLHRGLRAAWEREYEFAPALQLGVIAKELASKGYEVRICDQLLRWGRTVAGEFYELGAIGHTMLKDMRRLMINLPDWLRKQGYMDPERLKPDETGGSGITERMLRLLQETAEVEETEGQVLGVDLENDGYDEAAKEVVRESNTSEADEAD